MSLFQCAYGDCFIIWLRANELMQQMKSAAAIFCGEQLAPSVVKLIGTVDRHGIAKSENVAHKKPHARCLRGQMNVQMPQPLAVRIHWPTISASVQYIR